MNRLRIVAILMLAMILAACGGAAQPEAPTAEPQATEPTEALAQEPTEAAEPAAEPTAEPQTEEATEEVADDGPVMGGSVTRALTSEPTSLDPAGPTGSGQNILMPYIYDTLVVRDANGKVYPSLAEDWEISDDGTEITFNLQEGILFHDGTPLNAEAIAFSYARFQEPDNKSPLSATFRDATIEAVDELTVKFTFPKASAAIFSALTKPYAGIASPAAVEEYGEEFGQNPVGSGPFKLASWDAGVAITLERNEDYVWGPTLVENQGAPYIDQAVFKVVPDAATQIAALQAGEVDVIFVNNPEQVLDLQQDENIQLIETYLNSLIFLAFNNQKSPFDDVLVRRALSHAIDKSVIVQAALNGVGTEAWSFMTTTLPGYDPTLEELSLGYDPEQAQALLAEAGFTQDADGMQTKDGEPLSGVLLTSTRAPNQIIAEIIQSQFKDIGVAMEIQQLDAPTAMQTAGQGEFDFWLWRYDWDDPEILSIKFASARAGSSNRSFYNNPDVDALLEQAAVEMDPDARAQLYVEAQKLIMADAPWQPLYEPKNFLAVNNRVQGVVIGSMGRMMLNDAQIVE